MSGEYGRKRKREKRGWTYRTHWSRRVAYSSRRLEVNTSSLEGDEEVMLTLAGGIDDFYKRHPVVDNHLLPICIFDRWVICLERCERVSGKHRGYVTAEARGGRRTSRTRRPKRDGTGSVTGEAWGSLGGCELTDKAVEGKLEEEASAVSADLAGERQGQRSS